MSRLVKKCPGCGVEYPAEKQGFCKSPRCGLLLANLPPIEINDEVIQPPKEADCIVCSTCKKMTPQLAICNHCGAELSLGEVDPNTATVEEKVAASRLELLVGDQRFECRNGDVLGRKGTLACQAFAEIDTVSREHVKLEQKDGNWFITAKSKSTATRLDGELVPTGETRPLTACHRLNMSSRSEVTLQILPV